MRKRFLISAIAAGFLACAANLTPAAAQEVTLKLHQFLPPFATVPAKILRPWAEAVENAAGGKVKIEHYDAMSLGGRPPELMDQARDGVVDLIMTVVGYTPGRFPQTEVFELPFMMTSPVATSRAFWQLVESDLQEGEYADVQVLGAWVHGPGVIHSKDGVTSLEDMKDKKVRGPTRVINDLLGELGAVPVGMPLPAIPEALSKGVINATVIPWEVTPAVKLSELVGKHTEFSGKESLYTATIVLVMNKAKYDSLPADVREAIDAQSGEKLSAMAAEIMLANDAPGRAIAEKAGNDIIELDAQEVARWKEAAQPVYERWIADMDKRGIDGQALVDRARALIAENE